MTELTAGVCLTGDVHHRAMGGRDQRLAATSETELAREYLAIAGAARLRPTLFLTGRAVEQDHLIIRQYSDLADCELGGHGYRALTPWVFHFGIVRRLRGTPWVSARQQRRDMAQTLERFQTLLGVQPTSWRTHSYASDRETPSLLRESGVGVLSDRRDLGSIRPTRDDSGIVIAAINTWPDHEHIEHPRGVAGAGTLPPEKWLSTVLDQVQAIVAAGGIAIVLAHPICMHLVDGFETFNRLCASLQEYPSLHLNELDATARATV